MPARQSGPFLRGEGSPRRFGPAKRPVLERRELTLAFRSGKAARYCRPRARSASCIRLGGR